MLTQSSIEMLLQFNASGSSSPSVTYHPLQAVGCRVADDDSAILGYVRCKIRRC